MTVLVLGGTREARELAALMAAQGIRGLVSLAGRTARPLPHALPVRYGGFGGREGFVAALEGMTAVVDATHPFASRMTRRTADLCHARNLPCLRLERPPWQPRPQEHWHCVDQPEALSALVPTGARVLLATGPGEIARYAGLRGRWLLCRRIDPAPEPFPYEGEWLVQAPVASLAQELDVLRTHGITWIVAKNSGGPGRVKLDAAAELGLPVAMINRPPAPQLPRVETAAEALDWIRVTCPIS